MDEAAYNDTRKNKYFKNEYAAESVVSILKHSSDTSSTSVYIFFKNYSMLYTCIHVYIEQQKA